MKIKEILKGIIYGDDYIMPLWKELLFLLIVGLLFIGFSNAGSYTYTGIITNQGLGSSDYFAAFGIMQSQDSCNVKITCNFTTDTNSWVYIKPQVSLMNGHSQNRLDFPYGGFGVGTPYTFTKDFSAQNNCTNLLSISFQNGNPDTFNVNYTCTFEGDYLLGGGGDCLECEVCTPQYTSSECQSEYDLIPISDIDSNYCTENDLCIFTGNYSNLVINDIWHESKPFIYVNIPEEIDWDYTGNSYSFTLDVGGYNTDSDYIEGIITTQKSVPDNSDFQSIITDVLPLFVPGFVIILFLYYFFRLIKKSF